MIDENIKKYEKSNIRFKTLNLITDLLPSRDLIFIRDCFVHLSYKDIFNAISNIKKSGCKYLLTTTFTSHHKNHDIATGDWRPLNIQDKPFLFPDPVFIIIENCTEGDGKYIDKSIGIWEIDKL